MIERYCLKNVVIFFQTIINSVLSRKIKNIYNDLARKHGNVTVKDSRKQEKLEYKKNKLKLDINFLSNCKQLGVHPKFLIFKLLNVQIKMFHQFVNDSFTAPSIILIKNFDMFK